MAKKNISFLLLLALGVTACCEAHKACPDNASFIGAVTPQDLLPDGQDSAVVNGKLVRKGSVAAFLRNIELFESPQASTQQKAAAMKALEELAPAIVAVGLPQHLSFKNPKIQELVEKAEQKK